MKKRSDHVQKDKTTLPDEHNIYLAHLLEQISDAIISTDMEFHILEWNAAAENLYGWKLNEVKGHVTGEFFQTEYPQTTRDEVVRIILENGVWKGEVTQNRKDGTRFPAMASISLVKDQTGQPIGFVTVNRDISDRKQAEEQLRQSEERFSKAFHSTPTALVLTRLSDSKFEFVNESFLKLVDYQLDDVIGKSPTEINLFPNPAEMAKVREMLIESGKARNLETTIRTRNGDFRHIIFSVDIIQLYQQPYSLTTMMDVTERVRAEKQVTQMKRLYATLSQVNQTIVRIKDRQELYRSICDVSVQFGEFTAAWIGVLDEPSGDVHPVAANGLDVNDWPFQIVNIHSDPFSNGLVVQAIFSSKVMTSEDVQSDERVKNLHAQFHQRGYHSTAVVPFRLRGKTIGVLILVSKEKELFNDPEEVRLLDEMGLDISFALDTMETEIERRQGAKRIERQNERLRILREIDLAILAADTLESIVRAALDHIRELIECRRANLTLIDGGTKELVIFEVSVAGETSIPAGMRLPLAQFEDIIQPLLQNQPILFDDYRTVENPRPGIQSLLKEGLRSTCSLPLFSQGNLIGMFSMHSDIPNFFDEEKIALGREVANQVAIAISHVRLNEALAKNEERLRLSLQAAKQGFYDLNVQTGEAIVNRGYAEMLGYDPETFVETNAAWVERLHPDDQPVTAKAYSDYVNGLLPEYRVEFRQKTKQGDWKWLLSLGSIVEYDAEGKPLRMLGTHTDITVRKQAEEHIKQMKRLYATLSQVNQTIVRVKDSQELYQSICDVSVQFGEFALAWIGMLDPETGNITPVALRGMDINQLPFSTINIHQEGLKDGLVATALRTSNVVTTDDVLLDDRTDSIKTDFEKYDYHSTAAVPIQLNGVSIGVLVLISREKGLFKAEEEILLLKEMGGDISFALDVFERDAARQRAEQAQAEAYDKLEKLFDILPVGVSVLDQERKVVKLNPALERMLDITADGLARGDYRQRRYIRPDGTPMPPSEFASTRVINGEPSVLKVETGIVREDKDTIWTSVSAVAVPFSDWSMVIVTTDITERIQREKILRQWADAFEHCAHGIVIGDPVTNRIITCNPAFAQAHGTGIEEIIDMPIGDMYAPQDRGHIGQLIAQSDLMGSIQFEANKVRKDGSIYPVQMDLVTVKDENGKLLYRVATQQDITERKSAERKIRERDDYLRLAYDATDLGIWKNDLLTGTIELDERASMHYGFDEPARSLTEVLSRVHPDDAARLVEEITAATAPTGSGKFATEYRVVHPDGSVHWLGVGVRVLFEGEGDQRHSVMGYGTTLDISERKRVEAQIQRQLQQLRSLRTIDQAISTNSGMEETLNVILHQVREQLYIDAAAILLINKQQQLLECTACEGFRSPEIRNAQLELSKGYAGRSIHERRMIHVPDLLETGGSLAESLKAAGDELLDYYCIPLISKGEILGVLEIYYHAPINPDEEWRAFFEMIAGQAAIAIENSQLIEGLQRSNEELEQRVKERTTDLLRLNAELQHANRTKDEFLANMSHELRTPLTGILGLTESIMLNTYGQPNEKQYKALANIESSGRHLLELINDILDLSKIEAGKFDIYPEMINIEDVCRSSMLFVKEQAQKKSITLEYQPAENVKSIFADPRRIKQIMVNLLGNAVKFTPEKGRVTLSIRVDPEPGQVHFSVTDTGIGIAQKDLDHLFTPFTQVDSDLNRKYEGTGLGLALVLRLTEMHGGNIQVESEPDKGSRFTVSLPWKQQIDPLTESRIAPDQIQATETVKPNSRGTLLLAEDNISNIEAIGDYLLFHGYTLVIASNGLDALLKAEESNPDLILMDVQMPVMDGLESIRRLRADPRFISTPIIALTALAMTGDRERCLEAGANEYMSKPVQLKALAELIAKLLHP